MGLEQSTEKLDKYYKRLETGKAEKIKPEHVRKVIGKLKAKEAKLLADMAETTKDDKKARIDRKLATARELVKRAEWLLEKIGQDA